MTKDRKDAQRKLQIACLFWFIFGAALSNYTTLMIVMVNT